MGIIWLTPTTEKKKDSVTYAVWKYKEAFLKLWKDHEATINVSFEHRKQVLMVKDIYDYNNLEYQPYHEKIIFNKEDFDFFYLHIIIFFWKNDSSSSEGDSLVPLKSWKTRQALMGHRWQTSTHFTAYMHYVVLALDHPLHLVSYAFLYYPLSWPTSFFLSPTRSFIILSQQQCQEPRLNGLFQDPFGSTSIKTLPAQWVISAGVGGEYVSLVMERLSWVETRVW